MAKRILIVDDAAFMRMMIKDILTKNGYGLEGLNNKIFSSRLNCFNNHRLLSHRRTH